MNRLRHLQILVSISALCMSQVALSYESALHQQLTFIAAKQFSRCARIAEDLEQLSALDTRYIVRANVAQADTNMFTRMIRWNYYDRGEQGGRSFFGLIDTRFHNHFGALENALLEDGDRQRLRTFGRLLNYIQDVTSPAHVVPVFTARWWRFSFADRFDRFPVDAVGVESALESVCDDLKLLPRNLQALMATTAAATFAAVGAPIEGFPTTWRAYWRPQGDAGDFGEYGPAGNQFGERTAFACGEKSTETGRRQRCLLLKDDPLYLDFAHLRHVEAVKATIYAMAIIQNQRQAGPGEFVEEAPANPQTSQMSGNP